MQTLSDILARANDGVIRTCIHHLSPCAIVRLASIVAASLPLWSYSLRILHALCKTESGVGWKYCTNHALTGHSAEFRDVLLKDNLGLLDALLAKANASQRDFEEVRCVGLGGSLLSK